MRGGGGGDRAHAVGQTREDDTPAYLGFYLPPLCLKEACSYAARGGNREVLEWLHNTGCAWDANTCAVAAKGGHLAMLQWARIHGCSWDGSCAYAARSGHLIVLQWAREHHCPWNWNTCKYAAQAGHLDVLQWVRANDETGEAWRELRVRHFAGRPRKQEVLTWLYGISAP